MCAHARCMQLHASAHGACAACRSECYMQKRNCMQMHMRCMLHAGAHAMHAACRCTCLACCMQLVRFQAGRSHAQWPARGVHCRTLPARSAGSYTQLSSVTTGEVLKLKLAYLRPCVPNYGAPLGLASKLNTPTKMLLHRVAYLF